MNIHLRVNGSAVSAEIEPGAMLVDVLREKGFTEVKKGCGTGNCGVCTVLLDGVPVPSCSVFAARADGRSVTTVRGVADEAAELAGFLVAEGAEQCGFCSPGFALMIIAMKRELGNPSDGDIAHYLAGNLCRCSGYQGHMRAIRRYLEEAGHE